MLGTKTQKNGSELMARLMTVKVLWHYISHSHHIQKFPLRYITIDRIRPPHPRGGHQLLIVKKRGLLDLYAGHAGPKSTERGV